MILELHDPRPDDMAELVRLTAIELRKRGIFAETRGEYVGVESPHAAAYTLYASEYDNLGPIACADVIQAEEALRAQEWAGDG
jgi:hypothetical protein